MDLNRRGFFKVVGGTALGAASLASVGAVASSRGQREALRIAYSKEVQTICTFCGVGCGIICHVRDGIMVNAEGDPGHPVNEGTLCSKGASTFNLAYLFDRRGQQKPNPNRLTKPLYRPKGATEYREVTWDWAFTEIAKRIKDTRDRTFQPTATVEGKPVTVNRTEAITWLGSAFCTGEENYLFQKIARSIGMISVEHCARLCHSSTVAGLAATFGRGVMTNHWVDFQNADVFINIGGNTAECHPISMRWIEKAREKKGAKLIAVDPRLSRTAAVADVYVQIRPGTNLVYLCGLIHHILDNDRCHKEYVVHYTNASHLIHPDFGFDEETGLFSGAFDDPVRNCTSYDQSTWTYQRDEEGKIRKDPTLQDPNCVFQLMKKHYRNYTIENVSSMTGADPVALRESYDLFSSTGAPGKAGSLLYAMGMTQFTHGAQNTRSCGVVQLLLGNLGIAGGGVNAQRGQANVQGACDTGVLYHILPGYIPPPNQNVSPTLAAYNATTPPSGWWIHRPKYIVSLLKAFYGENATTDNEFGYQWLPKLDGLDQSHIPMFKAMSEGKVEGLICWADNPMVSGPSALHERQAMAKLKWLVSVDLFETETAAFWKGPTMKPAEIDTEVFVLPGASGYEREGTKTNSGRWVQWTYKAQDPPGMAKSDLWIVNEMFKKLRSLYAAQGGTVPEPITKMAWDYDGADGQVDIVKVCSEINGYNVADGSLVPGFGALKDDGSTVCGSWIYSGYYNDLEAPPTKRRVREKEGIGAHKDWSFSWPANRRIVYNRGSADPSGRPYNPELPVIWWDTVQNRWTGNDVPDIPGTWDLQKSTENPFIMLPEGVGRLFCLNALRDAPLPTHFEPADSPVQHLLYPKAPFNPASQRFYEDHLVETDEERARYPYMITTFRLVEHYQSGAVTRNLPWLNELMPGLFIEISTELAADLGIQNGEKVFVESKRLYQDGKQGGIEAVACVTNRIPPVTIQGKRRHIVAMPYHWGYMGMSKGAVANELSPSVGDPNTAIPEYKAFLCNVRKIG